ncbi:HYC_CC_PP family protein [Pontibacter sp. H249]|uniref:HYC_CC_PP family protein n=1 Tax=Pontibacter sp. H249 TaxID=3133420 RepID=UPI0030C17002
MKSIIRLSILTLLTLCILTGSVGVAFSEQICLMAGIKTSALAEETDDCCKKETAPEKDTDSCCAVKVLYEKLEPVSSNKVFSLQLPVYLPHHIQPFVLRQAIFKASEERIYTYSDSSPPVYGRKLLHQLHTLIV